MVLDLKIAPSGQTIVKPTALGPVANTDTKLLIYGVPSIYSSARTELAKLLIYGLFRKIRVLAADKVRTRERLGGY